MTLLGAFGIGVLVGKHSHTLEGNMELYGYWFMDHGQLRIVEPKWHEADAELLRQVQVRGWHCCDSGLMSQTQWEALYKTLSLA
jgi:hypothetical protein